MPAEPSPVRLLLVDDHPVVREGLALLLAPEGIIICAEASTSTEALARAASSHPDLALVDLSLGSEDGLPLVAQLSARAVPALVYSMHEDQWHVEGAFAAGALGYVTKRELSQVLVDAIHHVAAGRRFVSPNAAIALTEHITTPTEQHADLRLSNQEQQVYQLLGQGEGTHEIADIMGISVRTVESYYARMQAKLGLPGMRALRRHAINHHTR